MNKLKQDYSGYAVLLFSILGIFLIWVAYHTTPHYIVEVGLPINKTCEQTILVYNQTYQTPPTKPSTVYLVFGAPINKAVPSVELKRIPQHGAFSIIYETSELGTKETSVINDEYIKYEYTPDPSFVGTEFVEYTVGQTGCNGVKTEGTIQIKVIQSPILTVDVLDLPLSYILPKSTEEQTRAVHKLFNDTKFRSSVPQRDTWLTRPKYKSCAVVASGGSLKGSNLGKEIDEHEMVMRVNNAPTLGYQIDVGSKLSIGFQSVTNYYQCWNWNAQYAVQLPSEILGVALWVDQFKKYIRCGRIASNVSLVSYQVMDLADNILVEYNSTHEKTHSTGMEAVLSSLMVCDNLSLYGFSSSSQGHHHYYDPNPSQHEWGGYNIDAEKMFYQDLAVGNGPFMKYLKEYSPPKVKIALGQM